MAALVLDTARFIFRSVKKEALRSELHDVLPIMKISSGMKGNPFAMGLHHFAMFHCRVAFGCFEIPGEGEIVIP